MARFAQSSLNRFILEREMLPREGSFFELDHSYDL